MIPQPVVTLQPCEPAARLPIPSTDDFRPEWRETLAQIPGEGLKGPGFPHHVLGMLSYSPELMGPFVNYWVKSKSAMALSGREQELVILRMGCLYGSNYVWKHHVPTAQECGVKEPELRAVRQGRYADTFGSREHALLALTDELVATRTISAAAWREHAIRLTPREVVELIMLVSQYVLFALTNNALQVPLEAAMATIPGLAEMAEDRN